MWSGTIVIMYNQPSTHNKSGYNAEIRTQPWQADLSGNKYTMPSQLSYWPVLEKPAVPVSQDNSVYSLKCDLNHRQEAVSLSHHQDQSLESNNIPVVQMSPGLDGFTFSPTPCLSYPRGTVKTQHGFSPQQPSHTASKIYESNCALQEQPVHPCLKPTFESHVKGLPLSGEECQAHTRVNAGSPDSKHFQTKRYSFSTAMKTESPSIVQNVPSGLGTTSQDVSVISKLRQRERSWRGKRSRGNMAGDSYQFSPCKQFISEEKMAAKMSNLSITNDKRTTVQERLKELESRLSDSESELDSEFDAKTVEVTSNRYPSIQVCPELKTALSQQKGILPDSIVKSMTNTCNQLVLWRPPPSCIGDVTIAASETSASQSTNISKVKSDDTVGGLTMHRYVTPSADAMEEKQTPRNACKIEKPGILVVDNSSGLFDSMDDEMDL